MTERMTAYCGLVCTECPAFLATQAGDEEKIRETAELWAQTYQTTVAPEDVWCDGCLVGGRKCAHCGECEIRACGREKEVESCAHCTDYPCEILSRFFAMVPDAKASLDAIRLGR